MKHPVSILRRSLENLKSEFIRKGNEFEEVSSEKNRLEEELKILMCSIKECELAITRLEGKENASTSKNKKTK